MARHLRARRAPRGKAPRPNPGGPAAQRLTEAVGHHRAGRLPEAEAIYRQVLTADPDQPDALHLLGVIACQAGQPGAAVELIGKAVALNPGNGEAHYNLANALRAAGRAEDAAAHFAKTLALRPDHAEARSNLGVTLCELGRHDEAIGHFETALASHPGSPEAHNNLGVALRHAGRHDDAAACFAAAIARKSDYAEAHNNLGVALKEQGRLDEAVASYRRAIDHAPDYAEAHNNLGIALQALGDIAAAEDAYGQALRIRPDYAEAHYNLGSAHSARDDGGAAVEAYRRAIAIDANYAAAYNNLGIALRVQGEGEEAVAAHLMALKLDAGNAEVHYNLGIALEAGNRVEDAERAYRQAADIDPELIGAHNNLGNLLREQGRPDQAAASYRRAIEIEPDNAVAHNNLGAAYERQGRFAEAHATYRHALDLDPGLAEAHSNMLFSMCHDAASSARDILDESRRWNACHATPLASHAQPHANDPDPDRRLRVGYVSPDFRNHAVRYFIEPLIAHHDREAVEIFCYAEVARADAATARYRDLADHWRPTAGLSDTAVADRIREDRIDILVDLAGHTANHRLLAFAERPAPVQISHLVGLGQTTGMDAMDYVLTDARLTPDGHDDRFAETPWRLPPCLLSFRPDPDWPDLSPLPAAARGHVTFAAFGNPTRITPPVVEMWSRTLTAVPGSRLLLKNQNLADGWTRDRLRADFAAHGVEDRLDFEGIERGWAIEMDVYERVDIALDTFPMTGTTTSCIALWMGLPVVTLASAEAHDRYSAAFLQILGLDEGISASIDEFARCAAALAGNLDRLADIRAGLRDRMLASPLLDHAGCARAVEDAYRAMWRKWCASGSD